MRVIVNKRRSGAAFQVEREFTEAILSDNSVTPQYASKSVVGSLLWRAYKYDRKKKKERLGFLAKGVRREWETAILMGPHFRRCLPWFNLAINKACYIFDAWPHNHHKIYEFATYFNVRALFVSASQSANRLTYRNLPAYWIPEGVAANQYSFAPYEVKDIAVLQLGRKWQQLHEKIQMPLQRKGISYLYEKEKGEIIWPSRREFLEGMARTKISLCFPRSITDPEHAGGIETMTTRYLQSMASKCLIVGCAPKEMIDLFGYNPVIDIDLDDPSNHLIEIMNNFEAFIPLIEKNYSTVVNEHTWKHRWNAMKEILLMTSVEG